MVGEGLLVGSQETGLDVHDGIAHARHFEAQGRCTAHGGFGDDEAPALPRCRVNEEPGRAHPAMLLLLRDVTGEGDAFDLLRGEASTIWTVADDDELATGDGA